MSIEETIFSILSNDAPVSGVVGTDIFPALAPQQRNFPFLVYVVDDVRPYHTKQTASKLDETRVILAGLTTTYSAGRDLADKVRTALDNYTGTLNSKPLNVRFDSEIIEYDQPAEGYKFEQVYKFYNSK